MWSYNYSDSLEHKGTKGMKWGYNDGKRNGKRTAGEAIKDALGYDERLRAGNATSAVREANKDVNYHTKQLQETRSKVLSGEYFDRDNGSHTILEPHEKSLAKAKEKRDSAIQRASETAAAYKKTPLYKIEKAKDKIEKGRKVLDSWLDDFKDKAVDTLNSAANKLRRK